jgi:hypothetical protein
VGSLLLIALGIAWVAGNLALFALVILKRRARASGGAKEFAFEDPYAYEDASPAPSPLRGSRRAGAADRRLMAPLAPPE